MAEQKFNADLRIDRMIGTAQNIVNCSCSDLPDDWLESDFMQIASSDAPTGWRPLYYKPRDEFFRLGTLPYSSAYPSIPSSTSGFYTIEGRTLFFGGPPEQTGGILYQLSYYQEVPVMATLGSSWVYTKFPRLYLLAALMNADLHAVGEENSSMLLGQQVDMMIKQLNANHRYARASGSRLNRGRGRSFG